MWKVHTFEDDLWKCGTGCRYDRSGQTIRMGYFSQENEEMDGKMRVIDYVKEVGEYIQTSDGRITASQMLENFLFDGAMQWSPIEKIIWW